MMALNQVIKVIALIGKHPIQTTLREISLQKRVQNAGSVRHTGVSAWQSAVIATPKYVRVCSVSRMVSQVVLFIAEENFKQLTPQG